MKAPDILKKAAQHIEDRAAARDQPEGERSMLRTVTAFNALTGHQLTERDGWLFMATLKAARACNTPTGIADDYEDGASYFALAGESVSVVANDNGGQVAAAPTGVIEIPVEGLEAPLRMPQGFNWIAQDGDGSWWAYKSKPRADFSRNRWWPDGENPEKLLPAVNSSIVVNARWKETIFRVLGA